MPTATFKLNRYYIAREDDGWRGNGVDMYFGWIVQAPGGKFGGTSPVKGGLQKGNCGSPAKRCDHYLFSVPIPKDNLAFVTLYMYESDESTPQVCNAFAQCKIPDLHSYYIDPKMPIEAATQAAVAAATGEVWGAVKSYFDILKALYSGKHFNTDDEYGRWTYALRANSDTSIECYTAPTLNPKFVVRNAIKSNLPMILLPAFVDNENDVQAEIMVSTA